MQDHSKLNGIFFNDYRVTMNMWTLNEQDSLHLFPMAVIYTVSLHLCVCLSLDQYNKGLSKINKILS